MESEPSKLSQALAKEDTCPKCLGELDTGWECNQCGYDALQLVGQGTADKETEKP